MARVLAISSQVARGAIGLSAVVPALQALGHEVIALPTVLLSNHPGHARFAGERIAPELLRCMVDALGENGWLRDIDAILTGYMPSSAHVELARYAIEEVKAAGKSPIYVCDPVLGDSPKGLYIAQEAAEAIRELLVPRADVLKMNRFECGWLSRRDVVSADDARQAILLHAWPTSIVTSLAGPATDQIVNLHVEAGPNVREIEVPALSRAPNGTGDLMGGLYVGHRMRGAPSALAFARAVADVALVVERSAGADELQVAGCARELGR